MDARFSVVTCGGGVSASGGVSKQQYAPAAEHFAESVHARRPHGPIALPFPQDRGDRPRRLCAGASVLPPSPSPLQLRAAVLLLSLPHCIHSMCAREPMHADGCPPAILLHCSPLLSLLPGTPPLTPDQRLRAQLWGSPRPRPPALQAALPGGKLWFICSAAAQFVVVQQL